MPWRPGVLGGGGNRRPGPLSTSRTLTSPTRVLSGYRGWQGCRSRGPGGFPRMHLWPARHHSFLATTRPSWQAPRRPAGSQCQSGGTECALGAILPLLLATACLSLLHSPWFSACIPSSPCSVATHAPHAAKRHSPPQARSGTEGWTASTLPKAVPCLGFATPSIS